MNRTIAVGAAVVALAMVTSVVALPILGGVSVPDAGPGDGGNAETGGPAGVDRGDAGASGAGDGDAVGAASTADVGAPAADSGAPAVGELVADGGEATLVEMEPTTGTEPQETQELPQETEEAVEAGVDEGIELAQAQGVEVTQEQRAAAIEGATASASQHQEADVEQVQKATAGAVHGSLLQAQTVEVEQFQSAIAGSTYGALAQHQTVNATQLQSATWGAAHGGLAQAQPAEVEQRQTVEIEQIQVATIGAAAGAASEAGEKDVVKPGKIQEAAQGAAYGVLEQYQKITIEQRQRITLEHVQHAAAGASAGSLEGSTAAVLEQEQRITVEQRQEVSVKQIQQAAVGAAKGAIAQRQEVSVEQTQFAARGAAKGPLKQVQIAGITQIQRITITQIQQASFGAAKGAIVQSQEASVEQIQAAADGASQGALTQRQEVEVTQVQKAATGAAEGSVASAIQYQVVEVEQIQAASFGAGQGAAAQRQIVSAIQVQKLAEGAAGGVLVQHQEVTVEQIQIVAREACEETARVIQTQKVSVTQLQVLTQETAAASTERAIEEEIDDETELVQIVDVEAVQQLEDVDELEGEATIEFDDQVVDGERVVVDSVTLSEGGFVAIYDGVDVEADPDAVIAASSHLSAGEHEDLEIELDEPIEENRTLVAVAHHDTNGDETFDYVDADGEEDEPYVTEGGGPVLDGAFYAVEEDETDEPEGELAVSDQGGDGETLEIGEANASVDYRIVAEYDNETVESDTFDAGEAVENETLDLDPPIGENTTVEVSVAAVDEDDQVEEGETLANETVEYALESDEPEATLEVFDQEGDGETLEVAAANASVDYAIVAEYEDGTAESEQLAAGEAVENATLEFDPPIEADATVDVAVVAADDDEVLVNETIEYALEEPEGTLAVSDQEGDGETLFVEEANASVDYALVVTDEDGTERAVTEPIAAGEAATDFDLELDPPIEEDATVDVSVFAAEDVTDGSVEDGAEPLATETIAYAVEADEPEATLTVSDQEGDGTTLLIEEASASVDYALAVIDEDGTERAVTVPIDAGETVVDGTLELEPPLAEDSTLEVALVAAGDDGIEDAEPLATETIEYAVETELAVNFLDCSRAEVDGTFADGDVAYASTGFYDQAGFGNTIIEDGVTFGEDVDAPFTGTVVFEVGEERDVVEGDDEITVVVPDYGTSGTAITGLTTDQDDYAAAGVTHANPEGEACLEEIQPEEGETTEDESEEGPETDGLEEDEPEEGEAEGPDEPEEDEAEGPEEPGEAGEESPSEDGESPDDNATDGALVDPV